MICWNLEWCQKLVISMNETDVLRVLKDFVEGRLTSADWLAWWDQHEVEVKQVISPGEFLRLKPHVRSHGDAVVAGRCQKEACAVLQKRQIPFVDQTREQFAKDHAEFMARMEFGGKVLGIAEKSHRANVPGKISSQWYHDFLESGNRSDVSWIRDRTKSLFKCVTTPPDWVNEPEWPWAEDVPLVFVMQYTIPENGVAAEAGIPGMTVYLFSLRIPDGTSFRVELQIVRQQRL
jgi:hypothetical protein